MKILTGRISHNTHFFLRSKTQNVIAVPERTSSRHKCTLNHENECSKSNAYAISFWIHYSQPLHVVEYRGSTAAIMCYELFNFFFLDELYNTHVCRFVAFFASGICVLISHRFGRFALKKTFSFSGCLLIGLTLRIELSTHSNMLWNIPNSNLIVRWDNSSYWASFLIHIPWQFLWYHWT